MNLAVLLVSTLIVFSLCLTAFMLYMHSKRKNAPNIGLFELLFFANLLYMFGYALELASQNVELKLLFNHMQYLGLPFIAPIWLMICVRFCRPSFRWTLLKTAPIFIIPIITLGMNLTHTMNGLLYSSYTIEAWSDLSVVIFQKGLWYYAEIAWRVVVLAVTIGIYIHTFRRADGIRKRQALFMLLLNAVAIILSTAQTIKSHTSAIDYSVLLLSGSAILMFAVLFKYSLFDLVPFAYSRLFDGMVYPAMVLADTLAVVKANPAAVKLFPQLTDGREYVPLGQLFSLEPDMVGRLMEDDESIVEVGPEEAKRFFSAKLTRLNFKGSVMRKDYGYLLVFSDITSHVTLARDLRIEASVDPLTGLLNRRSFYEAARSLLERSAAADEAVSLIMIDIDHYKGVNDAFGHQIGDGVLKDVSHIIKEQTRESDVVVRYGGEEFVIMLPATPYEAAMAAANRICCAVRQHDFKAEDRLIRLTISVGVTTLNQVTSSDLTDRLIYLADTALFEAKREGRDRICYHTAD